MDASRFYVKLEDVSTLQKLRQNMRGLVEQWWREKGFKVPQVFMNRSGVGFLARHVATARYEDCAFIVLCERIDLTPLWITYNRDKFVTCSPVKYSYIRPRMVAGFGRRSGLPIIRKLNLVDGNVKEGVPLYTIKTRDDVGLVDWHRRILETVYPGATVIDLSDVLMTSGRAREYYPLFLSLAVAHGVLFEDYHAGESGEQLNRFTKGVFEPALDEVTKIFGVQPLIVPLPWWRELGYYVGPQIASNWRTHSVILKDLL